MCERTTADSYCCCVAVIALTGRRWKISEGAASSNTEQLETDGHYWSSLSERGGLYVEREGSSEKGWSLLGDRGPLGDVTQRMMAILEVYNS